jgi:hypothetical protein
MSTGNPFHDPTTGKSGSTIEILESLTDEELETYIRYVSWEQQHRVFDNTNMYRSRGYYAYRSNNWIGWVQEIQRKRKNGR